MPRRFAYYSTLRSPHHNNTGCGAGASIDPDNWRLGEGQRPLCKRCQALNQKESRSQSIVDRAFSAGAPTRKQTPAVNASSPQLWLGGLRF